MGDIFESNVRLLRKDFLEKKEAVERSYSCLIHKDSNYGEDHEMMIRLYNVLLDTLTIWDEIVMVNTSTYGQRIVDRIFELDAKYQGGKIKARNREDFIKEHLYSMVDRALELEFNRGMRTRDVG